MRWLPVFSLFLGLGLTACGGESDFERPYTWKATGANDANLRAMIADPRHLERGVGAATARGSAGSAAVGQLERGQRPTLPGGIADIGSQGSSAAGGPVASVR